MTQVQTSHESFQERGEEFELHFQRDGSHLRL